MPAPVRVEQRVDGGLGVRHKAEDAAGAVGYPGDILDRPVGVVACIVVKGRVIHGALLQRGIGEDKPAFAVAHREAKRGDPGEPR